ncbi:prepilin-type N-terminal cleavage/methylation domain-containing protein [Acinetobacter bereziniae]|uniref:pilin n=1 Tax=Acinetobacter bereziniae TaxID=106648 RepID=UPI00124FF868|nr:prepilin-type N-terminal cleavage/methylation domain-containing protein [Acinetobacter bereziniae]MCU4436197.1 prepilin-type N-terminal cleavage/methylation domain-containing protein [Acinetobacter bereziniae]
MKSNKGFTLVEIMLVTAVIGILTAIAVPSYLLYQKKTQVSACLHETKSYSNNVFVDLFDQNDTTNPAVPVISSCSFITDASSWNESTTNLVIEAKSKNSSTVDIRCDLSKGANCTIIP